MSNRAIERRKFIGFVSAIIASSTLPLQELSAQTNLAPNGNSVQVSDIIDTWMQDWMEEKSSGEPLKIQRFLDRMYFLLSPIQWRPDDSSSKFKEVVVPTGFVTDFASIPAIFWPVLPPDDEYAYAAVVHDYLYWEQSLSRADSDEIFRLAMYDLDVSKKKSNVIMAAVRTFGKSAWDKNASLKLNGERRILRRFPTSADTRWSDWKKEADVF